MKKVFVLTIVVLVIISSYVALIFRTDSLEQDCREQVTKNMQNPDELVQISNQEKEKLGMDKGLIPTRSYYETLKCLYKK